MLYSCVVFPNFDELVLSDIMPRYVAYLDAKLNPSQYGGPEYDPPGKEHFVCLFETNVLFLAAKSNQVLRIERNIRELEDMLERDRKMWISTPPIIYQLIDEYLHERRKLMGFS